MLVRIGRQWAFIGFIGVSLLLIVNLSEGIYELSGARERFSLLQAEVDRLGVEKEQLEGALADTNRVFVVEQTLRDTLGLAKPGETVVILPPDFEQASLLELPIQPEEKFLPVWKKWLELFI